MPNKTIAEIEVLIEKLHSNLISPDEFKELEGWYSSGANQPLTWDLAEGSREALRSEMFRAINANRQRPAILKLSYVKYAAAILIITIGFGLFFYQNSANLSSKRLYASSTFGKVTKVYLPDRSIVWLKGNSRLDYPSAFEGTTRNVALKGEALFEIAKDKSRPFIIKTSKYLTRVLGTSFNIDENNQGFKLTVLTGRVTVYPVDKNQSASPVILTPGKQFVSTAGPAIKPVIGLTKSTEKITMLTGTEYDMNFANTSFTDARSRIEKKFNVVISTAPGSYVNCFISADLTDQSLDDTLTLFGAALGASYTINNNKISLSGGGCN